MLKVKKSKKLKIAVVVNQFPSISETFVLDQIVGLIELGHQVDIFAFHKPKNYSKIHEKIKKHNLLNIYN